MVGQDVFGVKRGNLIQNGQPSRRCAAIAENPRHSLVLHHIARNQGAVRLDKGQFVAFGMGSAEPE